MSRQTRSAPEWAGAVGVMLLPTAFLLLLASGLYVVFPELTATGDARLQVWLGAAGSRIGYVVILSVITVVVGVAVSIGIVRDARPAWSSGVLVGVVAGGVVGIAYGWTYATARTLPNLDWPFWLDFGVGFVAPLVAGAFATARSGRIEAGLVAGVWAAFVTTILVGVIATAGLQLFASRLESGPWLGDPSLLHMQNCAGAVGSRLGSCEAGDVIGGLANHFLAAPLIGVILGALGGTAAITVRRPATGRSLPARALAGPALLCGSFLLVLLVEIGTNLW